MFLWELSAAARSAAVARSAQRLWGLCGTADVKAPLVGDVSPQLGDSMAMHTEVCINTMSPHFTAQLPSPSLLPWACLTHLTSIMLLSFGMSSQRSPASCMIKTLVIEVVIEVEI